MQIDFEQQLSALIFFHLEEHPSAKHLFQFLEEDDFARNYIAPPDGIKKRRFVETVNRQGLDDLMYIFQALQPQAKCVLPRQRPELGELIAVDELSINAVLSKRQPRAGNKTGNTGVHLVFDINRSIPSKIILSQSHEKPSVDQILSPGQTAVLGLSYQCNRSFDRWQDEGKLFACRIQDGDKKLCLKNNKISREGNVFYDAVVLLGTVGGNRTKRKIRVVGYLFDNQEYWIATNRYNLSGKQVTMLYKQRQELEIFLTWWKKHLKVYPLIARNEYGLMVQIFSGLITYLLLANYCREEHNEKVSVKRISELRTKIQDEAREASCGSPSVYNPNNSGQKSNHTGVTFRPPFRSCR